MTVREIMKTDVATCGPQDDLATAARTMHDRRCGFVPVVDARGSVAGVLTDRDVCMYAASQPRALNHVSVKDVMSRPVFSCLRDENVKVTIAMMANHHVRRLPVLDRDGHLQGVLSIDDVIVAPHRRGAPTADEVVDALKRITAPRPIESAPA